jgi:two-component system sensor histidine kinase CpxA
MRSIGLKIFLGFWLTHALIFVVLGLLPDDRPQGGLVLEGARRDGTVAASLLADQGPSACTAFLAAVAKRDRAQVALFDGEGRLACGSGSAEVARLAAVHAGLEDGHFRRNGPGHELVASLRDQSAAGYRIAAVSSGASGNRPARPFPLNFLIVAVLASGLVCFVLARYLATPILALTDASRRLAKGDLNARAGGRFRSRSDEIGALVRDFDAMAERIASLIEGQKQLLSDISHELRSPLARLQVALELARRKAGPAAEAEMARIQAETDRMTEMIAQLLAVSKAESDARTRVVEPFDMADIVREIVQDADYEARTQGRRVALRLDAAPVVQADPGLVSSAIENVVRNASRHTAEGTSVDVLVTQAGRRARVVVRDHGPGVPDEALNDIFSPFYRVGTARDRTSGGVGLGLSIAQRAVVLHGGTITAENALDGGLLVTIELPAAGDAAPSTARP